MDVTASIWSLLTATLAGFLIGLERERKRETRGSIFAGVRTFSLIALFGAINGQISASYGIAFTLVGFLLLGGLTGLAYWRASAGEKIGGTTEVAALVAFGLGVLAGHNEYIVALAGAVVVTAVLSLRAELHSLALGLSREDLFAVVQFATVSLIVLPLLPDEAFGPWGVWNPRTIWTLVVLISGISFLGYVATKVIGTRHGVALTGLLGGLASSTAVAFSFSGRSKANPSLSRLFAAGTLAASAVTVPRLLIWLGAVQPTLILPALPPLIAFVGVTLIGGAITHYANRGRDTADVELHNPFELKTALKFGVLFALILLLARAAEVFLGEYGLYLASALAGFTQLDAITLSLARLVEEGLLKETAVKGLAIAVASNNLFKGGLAISLGSRTYGRYVVFTLVIAATVCILTAWFFPLPSSLLTDE